jgi:hypothetical protein
MALPIEKVELGFDENGPGSFFRLDDPVKGILDGVDYTLGGGGFFYDVSAYVMNISVNRGKSRALDRYNAGQVSVTFDNRNRYFDPTYEASPFYGQIVPRRDVRIWSNGVIVFYGTTDDWNLDYSPSGESTATLSAYDGFAFLAQQTLTPQTFTSQLSGARVSAVLDDVSVAWPAAQRSIDAGDETLQGDAVTVENNVLAYLQQIETSEPGEVFIAKNGDLRFISRNAVSASSGAPVLSDTGSGIRYSQVRVVYGSELLYTQTELSRKGSSTTVQVNDTSAQQTYGIRTLSSPDLLLNSDDRLVEFGNYLLGQYNEPEYRFEAVDVLFSQLTTGEQNTLLGLELGSICRIDFTPNGIAPAISKYAKVISINHQATLTEHKMTLGLGTLTANTFVLDDVAFGILDTGILAF